jgi:hypothetical protein
MHTKTPHTLIFFLHASYARPGDCRRHASSFIGPLIGYDFCGTHGHAIA